MSLTVNSGPKALYLYFTQPFNAVDIDDNSTIGTLQVADVSVRDDLQGLKVWVSETSGFTPAAGNLVFDAGFQSIVPLTDLKNNTTYYIKYAFISKIDPDEYTTSAQVTATTLDTTLPISGFLNRDPIQIPTDSDGNNAVFTNATGTFVVYNLSTNVTGTAAVTYSVVSGSSVGGVSATIASTGVYTITGITDLVGTITLRAVYTNPQNSSETYSIDLVLNVSKQRPGSTAPIVLLTSTGQAFVKAKNNGTISPSTITFDATIANIAGATYTWYADGVLINGATSSTYTLSSFSNTSTKLIKVRVQSTIVATIDVFDQMSVYYLEEGSDALNVALVNENQTVTLNAAGTVLSGLPVSSQMVVARGSTILTSGVTYSLVSSTNLTNPTINSSTGIISIPTITNLALDIASATFKATVGTAELTKTLSISIVQDGRAAVINIGTVTTASSGSNATVTNTVTDGGATNTIDISIPRGADGKVVYSARVWLQTSSAPAAPTGGNFNASTGVLTAPSGWTIAQPSASTTPTYASEYTFVVDPGTTTNTGGTWSTPFIDSVRGSDGSAQERVELYLATSDGSTPAKPTSVYYTITGAVLGTVTGGTAGWSLTMPAVPANPGAVFMTTAVASSATPGTQITLGTWSTPVKVAQDGYTPVKNVDYFDGASAITANLTNESHSIPVDRSGAPTSYIGAETEVSVEQAGSNITNSYTWTITASSNLDTTLQAHTSNQLNSSTQLRFAFTNSNTKATLQLMGPTVTSILVRFTGTRTNYPNIVKDFTMVSVKPDVSVLELSNDIHEFSATNTGLVSVFTGGSTSYSVKRNGVDESSSWTFTAQATSGITFNYSDTSGTTQSQNTTTAVNIYAAGTTTNRTLSVTNLTTAFRTGSITVTASRTGYSNLVQTFSLSSILAGYTPVKNTDYFDGNNAKYWTIDKTASVLYKNAPDSATSGTYTSTVITGKYYDGNTGSTSGYLSIRDNDTGTYTSASNPYTLSPGAGTGLTSVGIALYSDSSRTTLVATAVIPIVFRGAAGQDSTVPGATGAQIYKVYKAHTSNSIAPAGIAVDGTTTTTNGAAPSGWSTTPPTLDATNFVQWESDGKQPSGSTTTTWSTPYLSYFKVNSLDAITATIGTFQSAPNGQQRTVISGSKILVYDSSNNIRVKIGDLT